jgi:hypothetical protein
MDEKKQIPIWFFIGGLLLSYGIIISIVGVYYFIVPAPPHLALSYLHADFWWGLLLTAIGTFYTLHFAPWRKK